MIDDVEKLHCEGFLANATANTCRRPGKRSSRSSIGGVVVRAFDPDLSEERLLGIVAKTIKTIPRRSFGMAKNKTSPEANPSVAKGGDNIH